MSLSFAFDIEPGYRMGSAVSASGNIYLNGSSASNLASYSLATGQLNWKISPANAALCGVCLVNNASALIVHGVGSNFGYLVELAGGYSVAQNTPTNGLCNQYNGQQLDNNGSGVVFGTSFNTNEVIKYVGSTFTWSSVTPSSGMSGTNSTCVINKLGTTNFLVGTANGKILELDTSGNLQQTITLPTSNNTGTAPSLVVTGLSYYNNNLFVMTGHGIGYHYTYSSSVLLNKYMLGATNQSASTTVIGNCLTTSACGVTIMGQNITRTVATSPTVMIDFNYNPAIISEVFFNEYILNTVAGGIDPVTSTAWVISGTSANEKCRVYNIKGIGQSSETTRIQNPAGTDVTGRIIRILDQGIGKSRVELDETISAGSNTLPCESQQNYIEISLLGTPNVNEIGDLRSFSS